MGALSRINHFLERCLRTPVGDVVAHCSLKKPAVLQHHAKGSTQTLALETAGVMTINEDLARVKIIKSQQEVDQRRLAATCGSNQSEPIPRIRVKADVAQKRPSLVVGEVDVGEVKRPLRLCQVLGASRVRPVVLHIEKGKHAPRRSEGCLYLRYNGGNLVEGHHVLVRIGKEALHLSHRERGRPAGDHPTDTHDGHHRIHKAVHEPRGGIGQRAHELRSPAHPVELLVDLVKASLAFCCMRKRADEPLVRDHLFRVAAEAPLELLLGGEALR